MNLRKLIFALSMISLVSQPVFAEATDVTAKTSDAIQEEVGTLDDADLYDDAFNAEFDSMAADSEFSTDLKLQTAYADRYDRPGRGDGRPGRDGRPPRGPRPPGGPHPGPYPPSYPPPHYPGPRPGPYPGPRPGPYPPPARGQVCFAENRWGERFRGHTQEHAMSACYYTSRRCYPLGCRYRY